MVLELYQVERFVVEPGLLPVEHLLLVELGVVLVVFFSAGEESRSETCCNKLSLSPWDSFVEHKEAGRYL